MLKPYFMKLNGKNKYFANEKFLQKVEVTSINNINYNVFRMKGTGPLPRLLDI